MERGVFGGRITVVCASLCLVCAAVVSGCTAVASETSSPSTPLAAQAQAQAMVDDTLETAALTASDVAAVVDGTIVTQDELAKAVVCEKTRLGIETDADFDAYLTQCGMTSRDFSRAVLKTLIDNILVERAAQNLNIVVDDAEVTAYVSAVENLFPTREKFLRAIEESGFTDGTYTDAVRHQMLRQRLAAAVIPAIEPTNEQISEYARTVMAGIVMKRSSYILIPRSDYQVALEVQQRLTEGEAFADLARAYSFDLNAEDGGDAGWDFLGSFPEEYQAALSKLEVGEVSPIVATKLGFYLIECTDSYEVRFAADGHADVSAVPTDIMASIKQTLRERLENQLFDLYLSNLEVAATIAVFDTDGSLVDPADTGLATKLVFNPTVEDAFDELREGAGE